MRRATGVAACGLVLLLGCQPSEEDARAILQKDGAQVVSLRRSGNTFDYEVLEGKKLCKGTLTIRQGVGTRDVGNFKSCRRDDRACKPGAVKACVSIADELHEADAKTFPRQAAKLYRVACKDGHARSCSRAADFARIEKKWAAMRAFAEKGCGGKHADGCLLLADANLQGWGGPKSTDGAIAEFLRACELGDPRGCRSGAGLMHDSGKDALKAAAHARKACDAKYRDACYVLGKALAKAGKGHLVEAAKAYGTACHAPWTVQKHRRADACNEAGYLHAAGEEVKRDDVQALALFDKACDLDNMHGCGNAGVFREKGRGAKRDPEKAAELLAKACKLGDEKRCKKK